MQMNRKSQYIRNAKLEYTLKLLRRAKCENFVLIGAAKRRLAVLFHDGKSTDGPAARDTKGR